MGFDGSDGQCLSRIADAMTGINTEIKSIDKVLREILEEIKRRPYVKPPDFSVSNPFTRDTGTGDARRL